MSEVVQRELSDSSQTPGKRFWQGAMVVQWWEHSPPTNLARAQILASTPYVGWVCCWLSPLLQEVFLQLLRFLIHQKPSGFSPQKPTFLNSNSTRNQVDEEPLCGCATSKSLYLLFIYLFVILFRRLTFDWNELPSWIVSLSVAWRDKNSCVGDYALDFYFYYYFAVKGNFIVCSPTVL